MRKTRGKDIGGVARKPTASPATGFGKIHAKEQAVIIEKAFAYFH